MKNVNNVVNNVKDLNYKLQVSFHEAKKSASFKELSESINLSEDKLMKYTSSLEEAASEYDNCKKCKALACCKNKVDGYCFLPQMFENMLNFSYVACRYKQKVINENKYLDRVTLIEVPKEIKEAKMSDIYTDDENRLVVIKWLTMFIKNYKNKEAEKGMFLHGNFGCGKTYLIAAMFNELARYGIKSVIVYYPEYLRSLKASFQFNASDEFNNKFNEVRKAPLLLLDDLGAETTTSWSRDEILGSILQYRMQEKLPTFITSNLDIKELETHLSVTSNKVEKLKAVRIIERIKQLTNDVQMISKNNRN
ncbi:MAG: primosomal protein DnaI [Bacilli bacterium]